jgi:hypothetical protein
MAEKPQPLQVAAMNRACKGKHLSEAHRLKISKAQLGKKLSVLTRLKMRH